MPSTQIPSEELLKLYKEYWATRTKFLEQIVSSSDKFGPHSDQVDAIQFRMDKAIDKIYDKIDEEKK